VLEDAGIRRARLLVSALHIEDVNRILAYRAFRLGVPAVIHAADQSIEEELGRLNVAHLVNSREASVALATEELRREGIFGG
jgi:Trk K+ transport system NAD-binding subunit